MLPTQPAFHFDAVTSIRDFRKAASKPCSPAYEEAQENYSVQIAASVPEVEALRPIWTRLSHTLDTDIDYYLHRLRQTSTAREPFVMVVYDCGDALAMLVGQIHETRASTVVSFVNIPGPSERVLEIAKGGRMGPEYPAIDRLLAWGLLKAVTHYRVDSVSFARFSLHSGLFREIRNLPGFFVKERIPHLFRYSVRSLPALGAEKSQPVFSGKAAREIRRKAKILDRAFAHRVKVKCFSQREELQAAIADSMRISSKTWQAYLGIGLSDSVETRESLRFFAEQGWLRIFVLYIQDSPCAFLLGQLYAETFHCQYAGYDPNYAEFSVGALLTARAFEALAAGGARTVDLGDGAQEHHRRWGCQAREEGTVHLYSPTLRGLWLSLFFGATQLVRKGGTRTRSALRLNRLSKAWRHYLLSRWQYRRYSLQSRLRLSLRIGQRNV